MLLVILLIQALVGDRRLGRRALQLQEAARERRVSRRREVLRHGDRCRRCQLHRRVGHAGDPARTVGLRQDHDPAHDRRPRAASEGRILIAGRDVTSLGATERDVSMVFQSYALFPHMTVLENVCYGLRRSGRSKADAEKRALEGLAQVGLEGYGARQPSELSGGQQQRVAVARALC
jgi:energy-coupling factor transporter ATP-binding protein EcfA2